MDQDGKGASTSSAETGRESDDSIQGSFERLVNSGKDLVDAELAWAKLKGQSIAALLRRGLLFGVIALVSLIIGLSLLLVATIVALVPYTGLLAATLIVIGLALLLAVLFGLLARASLRKLFNKAQR